VRKKRKGYALFAVAAVAFSLLPLTAAVIMPLAVVYGTVTYEDGTPAAGTLIRVKNLNTGAILNVTTDESGFWSCALPESEDWKLGDEILISAQDAFGNYVETNMTISSGGALRADLTFAASPPSPSPTPTPTPTPTQIPTPTPTLTPTPTPTPVPTPSPTPTPTPPPTSTSTPMPTPTPVPTPTPPVMTPAPQERTPTPSGFDALLVLAALIAAIYLRRCPKL